MTDPRTSRGIQNALGFSDSNLAWVVNAYTLMFGGLLLLGGGSGDLQGRRRIFITGMLIFAGPSRFRRPGRCAQARQPARGR